MSGTSTAVAAQIIAWSTDRRTVTIKCPHCRRQHIHGIPEQAIVQREHRLGHCGFDNPGYVIVEAAS